MATASPRMELDGVLNLRDLGGYPTRSGKRTRQGKYLRADSLQGLSPKDCERLYDYGLRYEVDLCCKSELKGECPKLLGYKNMVYMNVPLLDDVIESPSVSDFPQTMGEQYIELLERYKGKLKTIFTLLASVMEDCVVFHCAAGKDRTGVVAMLLLLLAEVPDEFIIADYVATDQYIKPFVDRRIAELKAQGIEYPDHVFRAKPESIILAMEYIRRVYGTAAAFLLSCGLQPWQVERLALGMEEI